MTGIAAAPMDSRHLSLDVVRGVAVMGILLMTIVAFAMPSTAYFNPLAYGGGTPADIATWATNFVLADGKMRGLFSLLFGASMLLVIERAEARGASGALTHYSRMSWLLLFGAIHAFAIWFGDILMLYALAGSIAFFFRGKPVHRLAILGLILIAAEVLMFAFFALGISQLRSAAAAPDAEAEIVRQWNDMRAEFHTLPPDEVARDLALYRGSYAEILTERMGRMAGLIVGNVFLFIPETVGLMLLGMAGYKSGFLTGAWEARRYARFAAIGYLVGLPLLIALAAAIMASGFDFLTLFLCDLVAQPLANLPLIGAHAALVIWWVKLARKSALVARVAAAGRAAFTNYLGTSIVCTTIFYGYGFGLYGELGRAELMLVVLGVWMLMLLWSKPWLDRFRYGPLEWLWRSLARRKLQPMRTA